MRSAIPVPSSAITGGVSAALSRGWRPAWAVVPAPRPTAMNKPRLAIRARPATTRPHPAPPHFGADPCRERHADHQGERLAAHHPAHGTAALVVGHAGRDL